ncbi:unnamed protein product [marine sediment metagenome]|uniref:Uncharacterized protein n=1 Tax=marine sediment metagenome TaxID=412755 RepID=X0W6W2_9ZZZZ
MSMLIAAAVASIAGSVTSIYSTVQAGKAAEDAYKKEAEAKALEAKFAEAQRRAELNDILAANINAQGESGALGEGTPESISLTTAKNVSSSEADAGLMSRLSIAQSERAGADARYQGNMKAFGKALEKGQSMFTAGATITPVG